MGVPHMGGRQRGRGIRGQIWPLDVARDQGQLGPVLTHCSQLEILQEAQHVAWTQTKQLKISVTDSAAC